MPVLGGPLRGHPPLVRAVQKDGPISSANNRSDSSPPWFTLVKRQMTAVPAKRLQLQSGVPEPESAAGVLLHHVQRPRPPARHNGSA